MIEVKMPKMGLTMEEGVISAWHKRVGDDVEEGEVLVEIDVDKAVTEIESPASGVLSEIKFEEGSEVTVGEVIAIISPAKDV